MTEFARPEESLRFTNVCRRYIDFWEERCQRITASPDLEVLKKALDLFSAAEHLALPLRSRHSLDYFYDVVHGAMYPKMTRRQQLRRCRGRQAQGVSKRGSLRKIADEIVADGRGEIELLEFKQKLFARKEIGFLDECDHLTDKWSATQIAVAGSDHWGLGTRISALKDMLLRAKKDYALAGARRQRIDRTVMELREFEKTHSRPS